jgi:hypothetical protein
MLREFMPRSNKTVADGLAVAVVLTLELAKLARVLVRRNHAARCIKNPDHSSSEQEKNTSPEANVRPGVTSPARP